MNLGKRRMGYSSLMLSHADLPGKLADVIEISNVITDPLHRKRGNASRLLRTICEEADESGAVLMLMPDGDEWLPSWYEKHGFQTIQTEPALMARPPRIA